MSCFLEGKQVLKCLGFAFLFAWILFGNYGRRDDWKSPGAVPGINRRLLSIDITDDNDINNTFGDVECNKIYDYNESLYCDFVKQVESCGGDDGFIRYFEFVYCTMPYNLLPLSMILLAIWLIYLFIFLGTTAEQFFCVSLTVITELLHLSQNIAGVTLLAIGNGAPDIFSVMAAFRHSDPKTTSLAFGALFGAGMYVTCFVVGLIALLGSFPLTKRPFLRDNIFYMIATYWALFMLWENRMDIGVAIGFLAFYIMYVLVVVLGSFIYKRWQDKFNRAKIKANTSDDSNDKKEETEIIPPQLVIIRDTNIDKEDGNDDDDDDEKLMSVRRSLTASLKTNKESESNTNDRTRLQISPTKRATEGDDRGSDSDEEKYMTSTSTGTPRPPSRMEQVVDTVVHVAEDIMAGGDPNLAKVLHKAYRKEREEEARSRGTTPHFVSIDEESHYDSTSSTSPSIMTSSARQTIAADKELDINEKTPLMRSKQENKVQVGFKRRQYLAMVKLFWAVIPFGRKFLAMTKLQKTFHIIKFPVTFFLVLTIPVVNKSESLNNWNRWLSIIHCVTAPVFASLATQVGLSPLGDSGPPAVIIFIIFGIILAVIVALTSSNDKIPFYHCIFAWAGFLLSVVWIYTIANEIVNLLQVFGVVVRLSDGILGLTLLAWGNSIQDTVTNLTMTRHGFPRMAVGACFGGPLLSVGLASIVKFISEETIEFKLYFTQVEMVAGLFLLFSLASSLVVVMCLLNFKMRRLYSIYLFLLYIIFLVVAVTAELKLFTVDWDELTDF